MCKRASSTTGALWDLYPVPARLPAVRQRAGAKRFSRFPQRFVQGRVHNLKMLLDAYFVQHCVDDWVR
jgi:hypothetical protein